MNTFLKIVKSQLKIHTDKTSKLLNVGTWTALVSNQELHFFCSRAGRFCSVKQDALLTTIESSSYKMCVLDADVEGRYITHERQGGD